VKKDHTEERTKRPYTAAALREQATNEATLVPLPRLENTDLDVVRNVKTDVGTGKKKNTARIPAVAAPTLEKDDTRANTITHDHPYANLDVGAGTVLAVQSDLAI
jgi:hypothetical protein